MIIFLACFAGLIGICLIGFWLFTRYSVADEEWSAYYSRVDEELDRREAIKRAGGAKILKFRKLS